MKFLSTCFLIILVFSFIKVNAQTSANYTATTNQSSNLLLDKNGNAINFLGSTNIIANSSIYNSTLLPIGFNFIFMGKRYTHFVAGSGGQIGLGINSSSVDILYPLYSNALLRTVTYPPALNSAPVIAAFWDNLRTANTGTTVQYIVTDTQPNQCLVIQWNVAINNSSSTATNPSDGLFQMRLYETTGEIEFVYGKMNIGNSSSTVSASIGFTAGSSDNSFIALKDLSSFAFTRLAIEEPATRDIVNSAVPGSITGLNSTVNGSRRGIEFVPVVSNGNFTTSSISRVFSTGMTLNWSDNISNKFGYLIYKSASGNSNYTLDTTLPASATSYIATGLSVNKRYYWKVISYTEGNAQTVQLLTDSTRCSMNGTYSIGAGGSFSSMASAQDSLLRWGLDGAATWQLLPGFSFAAQSLPITFRPYPICSNSSSSLTIQPASGASFNFVNSNTTPVILFDSTSNIIWDGRANGTGNPAITLEGSGELIRFKNAWGNEIKYLDLRSNSASSLTPVTLEATVAAGNHENRMNHCDVHDRGGSFLLPLKLLSATSTGAGVNYNNRIASNNFYNFKNFALDLTGKNWNISDNSFYATVAVDGTDTSGFINYASEDTAQSLVTNNFFGGTGPNCSGTTLTWNSRTYFNGLNLYTNSSLVSNHFRKIKIQTNYTYSDNESHMNLVWFGKPGGGALPNVNFNFSGNDFGGNAVADSIAFVSNSTSSATSAIIYNLGSGQTTIHGNDFKNIHTSSLTTPDLVLKIIQNEGNNVIIDSNFVGTNNHALKIVHRGTGLLSGIDTYGGATITSNIVTNLMARRVVQGIATGNSYGSVTNNTISYIKSYEGDVNQNSFYTVAGIATFNGNHDVSKNKVLQLQDSSLSNSFGRSVAIFCKQGSNTINANLIDGMLQNPTETYFKSFSGFEMYDNTSVLTNNMVRLGVDSAGNTVTGSFMAYSVGDYTASNKVIHNTFYITGTDTSAKGNGTCASWQASTPFVNNIMINNRYSATNSNHIYLESSSQQSSYIDYNIYQTPHGKMSYLQNFQQWQASGQDLHSLVMSPNFVHPDGPTRTLDLHVQGQTPVEGRGYSFPYYTTTVDYDGEIRSSNTPTDIGADAGNFIPVDVDAPVITVNPLSDATDTSGRFIRVAIADALSGLKDTGNTRPTIWYRKSYPVATAWQYAFGSLDSGTVKNGKWKFYINHQSLNVNLSGGDTIQYYFVAQDTAIFPSFNLTVSPSQGAVHTSVTQQVSPPATPYSYRINIGGYIIPSIVDVGVNQHYTSLTKDGGVFEGITKDSVQGDITIRITSHLYENGKWSLDSLLTARHLKLTIVPAIDSLFIIKNEADLSTDMLRFNNAGNVTIDGSYNGTGRWLRFLNTNTIAANAKSTIGLYYGYDSLILKNSEVEGNAIKYNEGIVKFDSGTFQRTVFTNNLIMSVAGINKAGFGIHLVSSATQVNIVATLNHFVNLDNGGMIFDGNVNGNMLIDSNQFYWSDTSAQASSNFIGIDVHGSFPANEISGNYFGGSQPYCGGSPWINNGNFQEFSFIKYVSTGDYYIRIENNTIKNFKSTNNAASNFNSIFSLGKAIINNNTIGDTAGNTNIQLASVYNAMIFGNNATAAVNNNLIGGIACTNISSSGSFQGIWVSGDSAAIIAHNIIRDVTTASAAYYISSNAITGIYIGSTSKNNIVEDNEIFNLSATDTGNVTITGIQTDGGNEPNGAMSRNRIYNLTAPNSNNGIIAGFYLSQNGSWKVENNQVTLTNGISVFPVKIYGIYDNSTFGIDNRKLIAYNSIFIGGSQTGAANSFGFYNEGIGVTTRFKNNLVVNARTGGGSVHGGIAVNVANPGSIWLPQTSNFNLFVLNDSTAAHQWGTGSVLSMKAWRNSTGGDVNSYVTFNSVLPADSLFTDVSKGNLNINTNTNKCWYLNGKAIPIDSIDADYNAATVRSTDLSNGPTDIGSNEFNTATAPPALYVYGRHLPGGSDTIYSNNRIVAILKWGNTGTLPTLGTARFYSGVWPNDPTNNGTIANARLMSGFFDIPATGGSGYSYDMTIYYDSSMLGKVISESGLKMYKRQSGVPGSWQILPTAIDTAAQTLVATNLTSFSEFTGIDLSASFPVKLISFYGFIAGKDVKLTWTSATETSHDYYEIERSYDAINFEKIGKVKSRYNGYGGSYDFTDANIVAGGKTVYYRLHLLSLSGESDYSKTIKIGARQDNHSFVISTMPSIFSNSFIINLSLAKNEKIEIALLDVEGKIRYLKTLHLQEGLQKINVSNVSLSNGMYLLRVMGDGWSDKRWVVKE